MQLFNDENKFDIESKSEEILTLCGITTGDCRPGQPTVVTALLTTER